MENEGRLIFKDGELIVVCQNDPVVQVGTEKIVIKPVMYDRFIYEDRVYFTWAVYPKHVDGRACQIDGGRQTVRARIDECKWL